MTFRAAFRPLLATVAGALLTACSGDGVTTAAEPVAGAFTVQVDGLAAGEVPVLTLTREGAASAGTASAPLTRTLRPGEPAVRLPVGRYTLQADDVRTPRGRYAADAATRLVDLTAAPRTLRLGYAPVPVAVTLVVSGLPDGNAPTVTVRPPDGGDDLLASFPATRRGSAGRWRISPAPLVVNGTRYAVAGAPFDTVLLAGDSASLALRYGPVTASLALEVTGLPIGVPGDVTVRNPLLADSLQPAPLTGSRLLTLLDPGTWVVQANPVRVGAVEYRPLPARDSLVLTASATPAAFAIRYVAQVGVVRFEVTGLPAGAPPVPIVLRAGALRDSVLAPDSRTLPAGEWQLFAPLVRVSGRPYVPAAPPAAVHVRTGDSVLVRLAYVAAPAVVDVAIAGLPAGTPANVRVRAPGGTETTVSGAQRFTPAAEGRWSARASAVSDAVADYAPVTDSVSGTIVAGDTLTLSVAYRQTTGLLAVQVAGVPGNASGSAAVRVRVSGPNGYQQVLAGTATLVRLVPGSYTITADDLTVRDTLWGATQRAQTVTVTAGATASPALVQFAPVAGQLQLRASGLPRGTPGLFRVERGSTVRRVTGTASPVDSLAPGEWTVVAEPVSAGTANFQPFPASLRVTVVRDSTVTAQFAYGREGGSRPNWSIARVVVMQATQRPDNSVPLVAGRTALVRVFAVGSEPEMSVAPVRIRATLGGVPAGEWTVAAPEREMRQTVVDGVLSASWNTTLPGSLVQPGLQISAELDPAQALPDANRGDNQWPVGGGAAPVPVVRVPPLVVRFVPVTTGANTGSVSPSRVNDFLGFARQVLPLGDISSSVRAAFTSAVPAVTSNERWQQVLSEVAALRVADGAPAGMHYIGVVRTSGDLYGIAQIGGMSAVVWDASSLGFVTAHELAHNFGRRHSGCANLRDDGAFPYSGGVIGQVGWDATAGRLFPALTGDLLGYCQPAWTSDHTWRGVLDARGTMAGRSSVAAVTEPVHERRVLIWGRTTADGIELEAPALLGSGSVADESRRLPTARTLELRLLGVDDTVLYARAVPVVSVGHGTPEDRDRGVFTATMPWPATLTGQVRGVELRDLARPWLRLRRECVAARGDGPRRGALGLPMACR